MSLKTFCVMVARRPLVEFKKCMSAAHVIFFIDLTLCRIDIMLVLKS
jgi:hypothetical protein